MLLWPGREADGSVESTTPSKMGTRDEMGRLEKVRPMFTVLQSGYYSDRFTLLSVGEEVRERGLAEVGLA